MDNAAARHASLRAQVADYNAIANAAVRGSDEQIAANLLAQKAQQRLARETAIAAGEQTVAYGRAGAAARNYERDVSRGLRGAVSASGLLRGAGRALAFGSTAFIGGVGATFALRSIVSESAKAQSIQKSLRAQLAASGISWGKYGEEIDAVIAKEARLAGVDEKDVKSGLSDLIRTTGSVRAAEKLLAGALDVSAGRHISLATAAGLEARVFSGNLGILKRYAIVLGSNVKTPLEALIALHKKFAGQAEAAGKSTEGAFGRAQNSLHKFEEGLGEGILPVLRDRLNAVTGALDDEQLKQKARALGETIAHDLDAAITTIVHAVRSALPEIERDFHDAEVVIGDTATAAEHLAHWLSEIASIVPGKDSLITLLAEGFLAKRFLFGKGAKVAAAGEGAGGGGALGALENLIGGAAGAGAVAKIRDFKFSARAAAFLRNPLTLTAALVLTQKGSQGRPSSDPHLGESAGPKFPALDRMGKSSWAPDKSDLAKRIYDDAAKGQIALSKAIALLSRSGYPKWAQVAVYHAYRTNKIGPAEAERQLEKLTGTSRDAGSAQKHATDVAARGWNAVKDALRATGAGLDQQKTKLEQIVASERKAAQALASSLDQAFSRLVSDVGSAFDAKTQQMLDNVSYRVDVVGKHIRESFTLRGDELTPAERELAALDKIEQRRTYKRDIFDARQQLSEALQIGDPVKIREAERRLQDAETEKRRYGLERRAALERKAADKAHAQAQKDLQSRRDLEKRQLDDELAAILKSAEQGKVGGNKAVKEILAVLRKHGVDFKSAGALLGAAFGTQLRQDLELVRGRADKVASAFERIANTKAKIHDLASEVARLAAQLAKVQRAGPAAGPSGGVQPPTGARGPVGPAPPTGAQGPVGGRYGNPPARRKKRPPAAPPGPHDDHQPPRRDPGAPPADPKEQRDRRHRKDTAELVGLQPSRRELAGAIEALRYHVTLPKRIDAAYLRKLGERTRIGHLERLIDYLEAGRLASPHWDGGVVEGPAGRDVILARLTRRELVLNEPQQKGLKRRLGVSGGPQALFKHIRGLARFANGGVAGALPGYAQGGVAGDGSYSSLLRMLTRRLARLELGEYRAQQNPRLIGELLGTVKASKAERARARRALDPVDVTRMVNRQGHSKRFRTKLDERLSQEQAHPFLEGLLKADPTGTALGVAGRTGRGRHGERVSGLPGVSHVAGGGGMGGPSTVTVVSPINLDGHQIAVVTREANLKHAERGYTRKRGAHRGKNLGMG